MKRAIVIGINYTGKPNALKGCVNDAIDIREVLVKKYDFRPQDIQVLVDDSRGAPGIPSLPPTKNNVIAAFNNMIRQVRNGDHIVFTFSGHGVQAPNDSGRREESDGRDECLLLIDGVLLDDEFSAMLARIPHGVKVSIITDCCHSGTFCDLKHCAVSDAPFRTVRRFEEANAPLQRADIIHFASAFDSQTASDGAFEGKWVVAPNGRRQWEWGDFHGAFTWSLLEVLEDLQYRNIQSDVLLMRTSDNLANKLKKTQRVTVSMSRPDLLNQPFF